MWSGKLGADKKAQERMKRYDTTKKAPKGISRLDLHTSKADKPIIPHQDTVNDLVTLNPDSATDVTNPPSGELEAEL